MEFWRGFRDSSLNYITFLTHVIAMTSVIAWIAAHDRRASGLYFASDSRRTVELLNGKPLTQDDCIKVFAPQGSIDIFVFAGDASFPPMVLQKVCAMYEENVAKFQGMPAHEKSAAVFKLIKTDFDALSEKPRYEFQILHGTRTGVKYDATFHLFQYVYTFKSRDLCPGIIPCDVGHSITLEMLGTGRTMVKRSVDKDAVLHGNVSRGQFSSFCKAVQRKTETIDQYSGGPIQLVGILSIKNSAHMGVVTPNGTYFRGCTQLPKTPADFYWRNTEFENVDIYGNPRKGDASF